MNVLLPTIKATEILYFGNNVQAFTKKPKNWKDTGLGGRKEVFPYKVEP